MIPEQDRSFFWLAWTLAILICIGWVSYALAHTDGPGAWINQQSLSDPVTKESCCNLNDCREETDNVRPVEGGYLVIDTGEVIPPERMIWRSPGGWWRCRYLASHTLPPGKRIGDTRCLIGPPPAG